MSEIEAAAPDQLFCACEPEAASALLAALAESDLSTIPLLGAELNWADQLLDLAGAAADGIYVISGAAEPSEASANLAGPLRRALRRCAPFPPISATPTMPTNSSWMLSWPSAVLEDERRLAH